MPNWHFKFGSWEAVVARFLLSSFCGWSINFSCRKNRLFQGYRSSKRLFSAFEIKRLFWMPISPGSTVSPPKFLIRKSNGTQRDSHEISCSELPPTMHVASDIQGHKF